MKPDGNENNGAAQSRNDSIALDIGCLELHGFAPQRRMAIAHAFEQSLTHLLAEQGLPQSVAPRDTIDAPSVCISPSTSPREAGAQLARAVYEALR